MITGIEITSAGWRYRSVLALGRFLCRAIID